MTLKVDFVFPLSSFVLKKQTKINVKFCILCAVYHTKSIQGIFNTVE